MKRQRVAQEEEFNLTIFAWFERQVCVRAWKECGVEGGEGGAIEDEQKVFAFGNVA